MRQELQTISIAAAGIALLVVSCFAATQEFAPYAANAQSGSERFDSIAAGDGSPGLAPITQQSYLLDCARTMGSWAFGLKPEERRHMFAEQCLAHADGLVASSPANSLAWFVGAASAAVLGDVQGLNDRLLRSYLTAPSEQWIANWRVTLAEDHMAELTSQLQDLHRGDLAIMAISQTGIDSIVDRYLTVPEFRERITSVVETLSAQEQQRFLQYVRRSAANSAGRS